MSGSNLLLDTNAIISLLKGNNLLVEETSNASWVGLSVINIIEFLSFPMLSAEDKDLFFVLLQRLEVIPVDYNISFLIRVASLRSTYKTKLPDAIIAITALHYNATLVTNDKGFSKLPDLKIYPF